MKSIIEREAASTDTVPVFQRWSTKSRILGRWQCWCTSPKCLDTCISQAVILVHKGTAYDAGHPESGTSLDTTCSN